MTQRSTIPGWVWAIIAVGVAFVAIIAFFVVAGAIAGIALFASRPPEAVTVPAVEPAPPVQDVVDPPPAAVVEAPTTVRVESDPPGAEVRRDGEEAVVCTTPCEIPSNGPADIRLDLRAPGHLPSSLVVRPGSVVRVTLQPEAPATAPEKASPPRRRERPIGTAMESDRLDPYAF